MGSLKREICYFESFTMKGDFFLEYNSVTPCKSDRKKANFGV